MTYALKDRKLLLNPNLNILWPIKGHQKSKLGQIIELGSNRAELSKSIQYTFVWNKNFLKYSDLIFLKVNKGHQRSNLGQIRPIGVKSGRLIGIYQIYIYFEFKIISSNHKSVRLGLISLSRPPTDLTDMGQIWVKLVKKHQMELFGPIEYNIHMF